MLQARDRSERRLDIEILRAVAVLSVLAFHFRVPGFAGGFVGVDLFFVISGFLISGQIQSRIDAGDFSYSAFFARRARRLVPALAATLLATWAAGVVLLAPDSHEHLLKEMRASATYLSNFLFWDESGYFDASAISKPLLHTWTLGIEEQFYLLWPLLLLLLSRAGQRRDALLAGVAAASLIACEVAIARAPSAAFFLLPFRVFEFAIGACAGSVELRSARLPRRSLDLAASLGVLLPVVMLDERSHFPGIAVLPSCLGCAWLIASRPNWLNRRNHVLRLGEWVGRLSYSAYLVHWPLVVFHSLAFGEELDAVDIASLFAETATLSFLLWRYVEAPALASTMSPRRFLPAIPALVLGVLLLTAASPRIYAFVHSGRIELDAMLLALEGEESRKDALLQEMLNAPAPPGATRVLTIGDSHSIDGSLALYAARAGTAISIKNLHTICAPLVHEPKKGEAIVLYAAHDNAAATADNCRGVADWLLRESISLKPALIVFSERWRAELLPYLGTTIRTLQQRTGARVVILGPNQEFTERPGPLLSRATFVSQVSRLSWQLRRDKSELESMLRGIAEEADAVFVSKSELVCPAAESCDYIVDGAVTYMDRNHWTEAGLQLFGERLHRRLVEEDLW